MTAMMDGMRAGVVVALVVTLMGLMGADDGAGGLVGAKFVASSYGVWGVLLIVYGAVLGGIWALWTRGAKAVGWWPLQEALSHEERDRRLAAGVLGLPVAAGMVGAAVMGFHLVVSGGFARVSFQAQAVGLAAAATMVGVALVAPLIVGGLSGLLKRLPVEHRSGRWTILAAAVVVLGAVTAGAVGLWMAHGLRVWSTMGLSMVAVAVGGVPVLVAAMRLVTWERVAYRVGIPVAGLMVALVGLVGAQTWVEQEAELRGLLYRSAPAVSGIAPHMVAYERGEQDIYGEGRQEVEEEEVTVVDREHPARQAVERGVGAGDRAQRNRFEAIPDAPPNVMLIMIDTLRQDHMGYAGYERDTTPNMDALAEESVVFLDAYSTSPHTPRSIPPTFFGRYASDLKWVLPNTNFPRLLPENRSMYEVKEEAGWTTVAETSHFYFRERRGLTQGFQDWNNDGFKELEDSHDDVATPRIWERLEPRIRDLGGQWHEEDEPFSLFVHFFDPHATYQMHEGFEFEHDGSHHDRLIARYDSEIAHVDSYVGKIVEVLQEEDLYEDTIVIITSDHGESFDEHGYYFHGQTLYNTAINVPLLFRVPEWFSMEVEGAVSTIDIAPTVMDLLGMRTPQEFDGEVLTDVLLGREEVPDRPVFAELLPYTALDRFHRAVIYGDQKLIVDYDLEIEEYYDLSEDPMEQDNLMEERQEEARALRQMLEDWREGR